MKASVKIACILYVAGFLLGAGFPRPANAADLFSPEGEWVAPGVKNPFILTCSAVSENRFFATLGDTRESRTITNHTDSLLIFESGANKEIALLKITDNALLYADGWITDLLLVRRGLETRTSPPSGAWIEGNFMRPDRVGINFTTRVFTANGETKHFQMEPARDQKHFPGLTLLSADNGKTEIECVRMGDDVLACRSPVSAMDGGGDNPFIGFAPVSDAE